MLKLTIAIPTYNRRERLEVCLKMLKLELSGVSIPIQVLVSDNKSSDDTWDLLQNWSFENSYVTYIPLRSQVNVGSVENTRNLIRNSDGEYILFCTDDDFILPGALKEIVTSMNEFNASFYKFSMISYLEQSKVAHFYGPKVDLIDIATGETKFSQIFDFSHVLTGTMIKREIGIMWDNLDTKNCYQSLVWCAISEKSRIAISKPLFMHVWENELFWEIDVISNSPDEQSEFLRIAEQEALLYARDELIRSKQSSNFRIIALQSGKELIPELDLILEKISPVRSMKITGEKFLRKTYGKLRKFLIKK
jgi:glycosyltransferase involved in cell wall biosynthesis